MTKAFPGSRMVFDAANQKAPRLRVSSRGYMLGYQSLDDPSVPGFYRFLAKVGDGMMRMQIVQLEFAEGEKKL